MGALLPKKFKDVPADLPPTVCALIIAAGGTDPRQGGLPDGLARILGAIPYIAVALWKALPPDEYRAFARGVTQMLRQVEQLVNSANPEIVFDALHEQERAQRMAKSAPRES